MPRSSVARLMGGKVGCACHQARCAIGRILQPRLELLQADSGHPLWPTRRLAGRQIARPRAATEPAFDRRATDLKGGNRGVA